MDYPHAFKNRHNKSASVNYYLPLGTVQDPQLAVIDLLHPNQQINSNASCIPNIPNRITEGGGGGGESNSVFNNLKSSTKYLLLISVLLFHHLSNQYPNSKQGPTSGEGKGTNIYLTPKCVS